MNNIKRTRRLSIISHELSITPNSRIVKALLFRRIFAKKTKLNILEYQSRSFLEYNVLFVPAGNEPYLEKPVVVRAALMDVDNLKYWRPSGRIGEKRLIRRVNKEINSWHFPLLSLDRSLPNLRVRQWHFENYYNLLSVRISVSSGNIPDILRKLQSWTKKIFRQSTTRSKQTPDNNMLIDWPID